MKKLLKNKTFKFTLFILLFGFFSVQVSQAQNNTVSAASSSPNVCINTPVTNITHNTTGATGISNSGVSGANGLPAGVSATWVSNTINISGTPTTSGTFNYSIALTGGVGSVNATGTIVVAAMPTTANAGADQNYCNNSATATAFTLAGNAPIVGIGTWTKLSGTATITTPNSSISQVTGVSSQTSSTLSWTISNGVCPVSTDDVILDNIHNFVYVSSAAGTDNQSLCINNGIGTIQYQYNFYTGITGVTVTGLPNGISYSYMPAPFYASNISGTPTASGIFNYTITTTGGKCNTSANGTITVRPNRTTSTASSTPVLTVNTSLTPITHSTIGATDIGTPTNLPSGVSAAWANNTITISGTPTVTGTFNYTIPLIGCGGANASGNIYVCPATNGTITGSNSVCPGGSSTFTLSNYTGSVTRWERSTDNFVNNVASITNNSAIHTRIGAAANLYFRALTTTGSCIVYSPSIFSKVENNWTGSSSNSWKVASNWSCGIIPDGNNVDITISSGSPILDNILTIQSGKTLLLSGTGTLTIEAGKSLSIASGGTVNFGSKLVTLKSDATGTAAIGTIAGTLSNANNVTVERYIPANGRKYRFLSSPVVGGSTLQWRDNGGSTSGRGTQITGPSGTVDASISNAKSAFYYDETLVGGTINDFSKWPNIDGNTALTNGKGYRVFVRGDRTINLTANPQSTINNATTIWVNGSYPSNPVTLPITYTAGGGDGWNLVGNPYPCAIDWDLVKVSGAANYSNISDAIYVQHPLNTNYSSGGYTSYISGIGSGTPNVGSRYISSSQGFMVKATGSSPVLKIAENNKVSAQQGDKIFKTTDEPSHLRLKLFADTIQFDDAVIHFTEGATKNFDNKYDAYDLTGGIGFLTADLKDTLAINGFPKLQVNDGAKICMNVQKTGTYKIMFADMSTFDNKFQAYFVDHFLNKNTLINEGGIYSFNIDANNLFTYGSNRFEIVFVESNTSDENILNRKNQAQLSVYPNPASDVLNINISNISFKNSRVTISNISGQELMNTNMSGTNAQINIVGLSNGIYFVNINNDNGFNKTVKFVK